MFCFAWKWGQRVATRGDRIQINRSVFLIRRPASSSRRLGPEGLERKSQSSGWAGSGFLHLLTAGKAVGEEAPGDCLCSTRSLLA